MWVRYTTIQWPYYSEEISSAQVMRRCGGVVRVLISGAQGTASKHSLCMGLFFKLSLLYSKLVPDFLQSWGR